MKISSDLPSEYYLPLNYKLINKHCNDMKLFISAQSKSENANKTGTRALGNQVIRKGHMCIQNLGIMKGK